MPAPERILVFGPAGTAKTYQGLLIARCARAMGARVFVLDTDHAYAKMIERQFPDLAMFVRIAEVDEYSGAKGTLKAFAKELKPPDWLFIDFADDLWKFAQRHFIQEIFHEDMGQYFLEARKKLGVDATSLFGGRDSALKGWLDWPVINNLYYDLWWPVVHKFPCNIYATAHPVTLGDEEDRIAREMFGPYGVKPAGQKDLWHQFSTIFLLTQPHQDKWAITTLKDRNIGKEQYMDHVNLYSLPMQYLGPVVDMAYLRAAVASRPNPANQTPLPTRPPQLLETGPSGAGGGSGVHLGVPEAKS